MAPCAGRRVPLLRTCPEKSTCVTHNLFLFSPHTVFASLKAFRNLFDGLIMGFGVNRPDNRVVNVHRGLREGIMYTRPYTVHNRPRSVVEDPLHEALE